MSEKMETKWGWRDGSDAKKPYLFFQRTQVEFPTHYGHEVTLFIEPESSRCFFNFPRCKSNMWLYCLTLFYFFLFPMTKCHYMNQCLTNMHLPLCGFLFPVYMDVLFFIPNYEFFKERLLFSLQTSLSFGSKVERTRIYWWVLTRWLSSLLT